MGNLFDNEKWYDIVGACSGTDSTGHPNAVTVAGLDEILDEEHARALERYPVDNAAVTVYSNGGCSVIVLSWGKRLKRDYLNFMRIAGKYFDEDEEKPTVFSLTLLPKSYGERIGIQFADLVYMDSIELKDQFKITFSFNNDCTFVFETGFDREMLVGEVRSELNREREELSEELYAIERRVENEDSGELMDSLADIRMKELKDMTKRFEEDEQQKWHD